MITKKTIMKYRIDNLISKIEYKIISSEFKKHFLDDIEKRYVFSIMIIYKKRDYTFYFGQSISEGNNEPDIKEVLQCLQKTDIGSFEDFCAEYGYHNDSIKAEKVYKAVLLEVTNMQRLFNDEELAILSELE